MTAGQDAGARASAAVFYAGSRKGSAVLVDGRYLVTAGPTVTGAVQMDWAQQAGTRPGHSGGPVLDPRRLPGSPGPRCGR